MNDAPALAAADIGVAMGVGAALAMETADVTLLDSNLKKLLYSVNMGRRVMWKIKENVAFSLIVKAIVLGFTVAGKVALWAAIVSDVGAMICVTLNGMRLLPSSTISREKMGDIENVTYHSQVSGVSDNDKEVQIENIGSIEIPLALEEAGGHSHQHEHGHNHNCGTDGAEGHSNQHEHNHTHSSISSEEFEEQNHSSPPKEEEGHSHQHGHGHGHNHKSPPEEAEGHSHARETDKLEAMMISDMENVTQQENDDSEALLGSIDDNVDNASAVPVSGAPKMRASGSSGELTDGAFADLGTILDDADKEFAKILSEGKE